jgi:hypothetical protein
MIFFNPFFRKIPSFFEKLFAPFSRKISTFVYGIIGAIVTYCGVLPLVKIFVQLSKSPCIHHCYRENPNITGLTFERCTCSQELGVRFSLAEFFTSVWICDSSLFRTTTKRFMSSEQFSEIERLITEKMLWFSLLVLPQRSKIWNLYIFFRSRNSEGIKTYFLS